ncbi:MAG: peroxidase [Methylococcales bacterium]
MNNSSDFKFDDLQGLLRYGHGKLTDSCFLLLNITDVKAAKQWLNTAPVTSATQTNTPPKTALQIAFSVEGLRTLGLKESVIEEFSDEFITGMSGDESRSRRLGDVGANAPEQWDWGGNTTQLPHVLLLLYAKENRIDTWRKTVEDDNFSKAFQLLKQLPTLDIGEIEPFGFKDGISQPKIDWQHKQSTDLHNRDDYSNLLAAGEVVLGYLNEYGLYTARPLIDPEKDSLAAGLPNAQDQPTLKDFGRNGTYLVLRQLAQDVPGFWQFLDKETGSVPEKREQLAASMVGRERNGEPLAPLKPPVPENIPGIASDDQNNHFTYDLDPRGSKCPIGAHLRRSNPRTGDLPSGITGFISRLMKTLGFGQSHLEEDLVASSRFHRLLRRGRAYGSILTPEQAVKTDAEVAERGLQFICLAGNILRQFEFVQNAWSMSSQFSGLQQESDPLLGNRQPLRSGDDTDQFNRPDPAGPKLKTCHLPQFVTVRGGGYFFMPGLRAIKYIASIPSVRSNR